MINSDTLYAQASLAQAAYAEALAAGSPVGVLKEQLKDDADFAETQATAFAADFAVVLQYNDSIAEGGLDTGLSLTVFRDKATNALTLAIRGTSPSDVRDLLTDGDIFVGGAGYDQIVALFNWWQRASTAAGPVPQYFFVLDNTFYPDALPVGGGYLARTHDASATGTLVAALAAGGGRVDVTGHSLGGHLAMAFQALFPRHGVDLSSEDPITGVAAANDVAFAGVPRSGCTGQLLASRCSSVACGGV